MSHTPCQNFVPEYGNKLVLVSGGKNDECGAIAESYLFEKGRERKEERRGREDTDKEEVLRGESEKGVSGERQRR